MTQRGTDPMKDITEDRKELEELCTGHARVRGSTIKPVYWTGPANQGGPVTVTRGERWKRYLQPNTMSW